MKRNKFYGTGVAIVTPFNEKLEVDYASLTKLLENIINNGVDYIVALGTTGESVTLSADEKKSVVEHVKKVINKRVPLVIGIGGNNTTEVLKQFDYFDFNGIDAVLSVSPYYNKPQQQGIIEHYKLIAKKSPKPIILYNVPGRTGASIKAETTLYLAKNVDNIIGIKEASGNFEQIMKIIKDKPKDFLVISGDDALTLPLISLGMVGVISVIANAYPKQFSQMVNDCLAGNFELAKENHYKLLDITEAIFAEGSPSGVKYLLEHQGICKSYVRLPLFNISENLKTKIAALHQKIN